MVAACDSDGGEVEVTVGDGPTLAVSIDAGSYVFICNIVEEGALESHYQEGMRVGLRVE